MSCRRGNRRGPPRWRRCTSWPAGRSWRRWGWRMSAGRSRHSSDFSLSYVFPQNPESREINRKINIMMMLLLTLMCLKLSEENLVEFSDESSCSERLLKFSKLKEYFLPKTSGLVSLDLFEQISSKFSLNFRNDSPSLLFWTIVLFFDFFFSFNTSFSLLRSTLESDRPGNDSHRIVHWWLKLSFSPEGLCEGPGVSSLEQTSSLSNLTLRKLSSWKWLYKHETFLTSFLTSEFLFWSFSVLSVHSEGGVAVELLTGLSDLPAVPSITAQFCTSYILPSLWYILKIFNIWYFILHVIKDGGSIVVITRNFHCTEMFNIVTRVNISNISHTLNCYLNPFTTILRNYVLVTSK